MPRAKLNTREQIFLHVIETVEIARNNRSKGVARNDEKAKDAAVAKRPARRALRRARRELWEAWRERREFARRQAKRGQYLLLPASHGPGTRACYACGVNQPAAVFVDASALCHSCIPQVNALSAALASLRAARARARKKLTPAMFGSPAVATKQKQNCRADLEQTLRSTS